MRPHLLVPETNLAAGCRGDKLSVRTNRTSCYHRLVSLRWRDSSAESAHTYVIMHVTAVSLRLSLALQAHATAGGSVV